MPNAKTVVKKLVLVRETVRTLRIESALRAGAANSAKGGTGSWGNSTTCGSAANSGGGDVNSGDPAPGTSRPSGHYVDGAP